MLCKELPSTSMMQSGGQRGWQRKVGLWKDCRKHYQLDSGRQRKAILSLSHPIPSHLMLVLVVFSNNFEINTDTHAQICKQCLIRPLHSFDKHC